MSAKDALKHEFIKDVAVKQIQKLCEKEYAKQNL